MADFELTDAQAEKLNRAMAGEQVDLDESEVQLFNQAIAAAAPPKAQPQPEEPGWFDPKAASGAVLRGGAQGASLGFGDELNGFVGAGVAGLTKHVAGALKSSVGRALLRAHLGAKGSNLPDAALDALVDGASPEAIHAVTGIDTTNASRSPYQQARDSARSENETAQEESPYIYGASELAGSLAAPVPGPGGAKPLQSIGSRLLQLGKYGAKMGAAGALGSSKSDLADGDVGGVARDVGTGAALGGVGGAVLGTAMDVGPARLGKLTGLNEVPGVGRFVPERTLAQMSRDYGLEKLIQSVVPAAGLSNRLRNKLGVANKTERTAFAEGIERGNFVQPFETSERALERVEGTLQGEGGAIGDYLDRADEMVKLGAKPASRDVQQSAVDRAMRQAINTPSAVQEGTPVWKELSKRTGNDRTNGLLGPATYRELWANKSAMQQSLKPQDVSNLAQNLYRKGVSGYTRGVYGQLESALGPKSVEGLREAADRYGTAASIEDLLREKSSRELQRSNVGLLDLQKAQLAGETFKGIPLAGPAAAIISSIVRPRIDPTLATGALGLSKVLDRGLHAGAATATRALATNQDALVKALRSKKDEKRR